MEHSLRTHLFPLFHISDASKKILMRGSRKMTVFKDQIVVQKGDEVSGVFFVQSGSMRVFVMHPNGKEATLYKVSPNEICLLSLNSAFSKISYPAWVGVESKSAVISVLPSDNLKELFRKDETIQDLVLQSLTATIKDLMTNLDQALLSTLKDRILSFLLNNSGADGVIKITHDELASHLGTSREVVSREILALKKSKLLTSNRGHIQITKKLDR